MLRDISTGKGVDLSTKGSFLKAGGSLGDAR